MFFSEIIKIIFMALVDGGWFAFCENEATFLYCSFNVEIDIVCDTQNVRNRVHKVCLHKQIYNGHWKISY